jgi:hypothetical protein
MTISKRHNRPKTLTAAWHAARLGRETLKQGELLLHGLENLQPLTVMSKGALVEG